MKNVLTVINVQPIPVWITLVRTPESLVVAVEVVAEAVEVAVVGLMLRLQPHSVAMIQSLVN
jgi:hypothetical protein